MTIELNKIAWLELRNIIKNIWYKYLSWNITFQEWKEQSQKYIDEVNKRQEKITKEYWKKYYPITFANTCR
jgi:fructose-1,6-bisphosphatase